MSWERQIGDWTIGQHYSGGPQVLDGKVVVGMSGCYYINTGCWITAHDPETGEEIGEPIRCQKSESRAARPGAMCPMRSAGGLCVDAVEL